MKKCFLLLSLPSLFLACTLPDWSRGPQPIADFAEADCSVESKEPTLVEWQWVQFELPWCWSALDISDSEQPLLVLQDQEGAGMVTITYDPQVEPFDLAVTTLFPDDPDTVIIVNSFK